MVTTFLLPGITSNEEAVVAMVVATALTGQWNHNEKKLMLSWSTGKDSAWCLYQLLQQADYDVAGLFCTINRACPTTVSNCSSLRDHNLNLFVIIFSFLSHK